MGAMRSSVKVLVSCLVLAACRFGAAEPVAIPAGVDPAPWDRLLKAYVDERGLVDYRAWKASAADRKALADYLARFAAAPTPPAAGDGRSAGLVDLYNATVVSWVLDHYPIDSIRSTPDPFGGRRHTVGGRTVSLDDIEHESLRPLVGFRVHAALVCGARSCPPLSRDAHRAGGFGQQLDAAMRRWLARDDLNHFDPAGRASLSSIFKWYRADFEKAGGIAKVLEAFGPEAARKAARSPGFRIEILDYDWKLNER
jgi:hypothetical protein